MQYSMATSRQQRPKVAHATLFSGKTRGNFIQNFEVKLLLWKLMKEKMEFSSLKRLLSITKYMRN